MWWPCAIFVQIAGHAVAFDFPLMSDWRLIGGLCMARGRAAPDIAHAVHYGARRRARVLRAPLGRASP